MRGVEVRGEVRRMSRDLGPPRRRSRLGRASGREPMSGCLTWCALLVVLPAIDTRLRVTPTRPYASIRGPEKAPSLDTGQSAIGDEQRNALSIVCALLRCEPTAASGAVLVRAPGLGDDRLPRRRCRAATR